MECVKIFLSFFDLFENEKIKDGDGEEIWIFKYGDMIVNSILIQGYIESSSEESLSINDGTSTLTVSKDDGYISEKEYHVGEYYQFNVLLDKDHFGNFIATITHALDWTSSKKDRELLWFYEVLHIHYKVYKSLANLKNLDSILKSIKEKRLKVLGGGNGGQGDSAGNDRFNDQSLIEITDGSIQQVAFEIDDETVGDYELPDDNVNSNSDLVVNDSNSFDIAQEDLSIEYELLEEESRLNNNNRLNSTINLDDDEVNGYEDINESNYDDMVFNDEGYDDNGGGFTVNYNLKDDNENNNAPKDIDIQETDDFETKSDDSWN